MTRLLPYESPEDAEKQISPAPALGQDKADLASLDDDQNLRKAIVTRENQVRELRTKAYEHAVTVCFGFSAYLGAMVALFAFGSLEAISDQAQVAIFATPILSIAAITIFILRGVFGTPSAKSFSEELRQVTSLTKDVSGVGS